MSKLSLFQDYKESPTIEKRNKLVEENLYLVDILIRKYIGKGVEYEDLYQVGALALVAAVERFDPYKGFEFSSFATPTILGEIKKHFRDKQWSLKVPRRLKEISAKVQEVSDQLYNKFQRKPNIQEIAEESGFSVEQVLEAMEGAKAYGTYSLDKTFDESGEDGEGAIFEKFTSIDEKGFEKVELSEIIENVIREFSDQYKVIFKERFINNKSQSDVAKKLGVSQMTVSRAERNMISMFRTELHR